MNTTIPAAAQAKIDLHRRTLRKNPRDANTHALLGLALLKVLQLEDGVASLQRALELDPKIRGVHGILAGALFDLQRYEAAAACYRKALRHQDAADMHQHLGTALLRLGRAGEAEPSARRAAELAPRDAGAQLALASVLLALGRHDDAEVVMRQVATFAPNQADAHYQLGLLLCHIRKWDAALASMNMALSADPVHVEALRHLGLCQRELGRADDTLATLERAMELAPDNRALQDDLCASYQKFRRHRQAIAIARRILADRPDSQRALNALVSCHFALGEWEDALAAARLVLALHPSAENNSMLLFVLSHCCGDPEQLTREHFAFGERWEAPLVALRQPHTNDRDPRRVLRVGLVSGDLYSHAVARFIAPALESLKDSAQLRFYVYYNNRIEDNVTRAMQPHVSAWRSIVDLDDAAAERLVRDDAIDILIDLSGHSALNRLALFARKPAPVQATWIGYAGTTGLRSMDYILCDRFLVPGERYTDQFTENIVKLPLGGLFLPEPVSPPVNPSPAMQNGYLTFGSFHRASKLGREVIALWASLLHAIPDAKMLLGGMEAGVDDVLVDWFAAAGIGRERLLLRPRTSIRAYLEQHYEVDICLSPFPYSGSTTIGHALWMGVPTLATVGPTNPSHAAAPFMAHVGLSTFITESPETYVKLGVFLSQNIPALASMRATMRKRFLESTLGYPGIVGASLELALRRMWERWCGGMPAAPFTVTMQELVELGQPAQDGSNAIDHPAHQ